MDDIDVCGNSWWSDPANVWLGGDDDGDVHTDLYWADACVWLSLVGWRHESKDCMGRARSTKDVMAFINAGVLDFDDFRWFDGNDCGDSAE